MSSKISFEAQIGASTQQAKATLKFDVFDLNRVPPKRAYKMCVKYKFIRRGKPLAFYDRVAGEDETQKEKWNQQRGSGPSSADA